MAQLKEEEIKLLEQIANIKNRYNIALDKLSRLQNVRDIIPNSRYEDVLVEKNALMHEKKSLEATLLQNRIKKEQLEKQIQTIKSPIDGYVNTLNIHTIGGVVTPAQEIVTIVPKNAKLKIKAKVLNQDIGFIEKGMDTSIKIDTFNFKKYGIIKGEIITVSPNSMMVMYDVEDKEDLSTYSLFLNSLAVANIFSASALILSIDCITSLLWAVVLSASNNSILPIWSWLVIWERTSFSPLFTFLREDSNLLYAESSTVVDIAFSNFSFSLFNALTSTLFDSIFPVRDLIIIP